MNTFSFNNNYQSNHQYGGTTAVQRSERLLDSAAIQCSFCCNIICTCNAHSSRSISPISLNNTTPQTNVSKNDYEIAPVAKNNSYSALFNYSAYDSRDISNCNFASSSFPSPEPEYTSYSLIKSIWSPLQPNSSGSNLSTLNSMSESPSTRSSFTNPASRSLNGYDQNQWAKNQLHTPPADSSSAPRFSSIYSTPTKTQTQTQIKGNSFGNFDFCNNYLAGIQNSSPETTHPKYNSVLLQPPIIKPSIISPHSVSVPTTSKFFVIKSYNEVDVTRSFDHKVWSSTVLGNKRLDAAYKQAAEIQGNVYLFFSVNSSGQFCGVAEMKNCIDFTKTSDIWLEKSRWKGVFPLEWIFVKNVNNHNFKHLKIPQNEFKPVTNSRDTQEIPFEIGLTMLHIFKNNNSSSSFFQKMSGN